MKRVGIVSLALLALCALSALAASMASAEEGTLPQQGAKVFKIASQGGNFVLETTRGESLICTAMKGEGKFLEKSDQHATGTLTLTGCTASGFAASTLGAASGTVIITVIFLTCLVTPSVLLHGVLILLEATVHIEVLFVKLLILVKGAFIAHNLSGNLGKEYLFALEGAKGVQTVAPECELLGKKFKHTLESSVSTKEDVPASVKAKFVVTFGETVELMDT